MAPRSVFVALADTDDLDVDARSEPVLLIVILAGMATIILTPAWGTVMDDGTVDGLVLVVLTFIGGLFYGAAGYFFLGLALWLGARGVGVEAPFRIARQVVAFAAVPIALSALVVVPLIAFRFGWDWFRTTGSDTGTGRDVVVGIGLAFMAWSARARRPRAPNHLPAAVARRRGRAPPRRRDRRRVRRAPERPLAGYVRAHAGGGGGRETPELAPRDIA